MTAGLRAAVWIAAAVVTLAIASACDTNIAGPNTIAPPSDGVFVGKVYPDGRTRWPFEMTSAGTVSIGFTRIDPPVRLGIAFGELEGLECHVTSEIEVSPAASSRAISSAVGAGEKCIEVFDVGTVPLSGVTFSVTIHAS